MQQPRSALYVVEAYGITNPWVLWRLERGALGDACQRCGGRQWVVTSPCSNREPDPMGVAPTCRASSGCEECRRPCPDCWRTRATVHAEDFGDEASAELARRLFPTLEVDHRPRVDRNPRAL